MMTELTDGKRVIELHRLQGYEHTGDMLVVICLPKGFLGEPDAFTPPAMPGIALIPLPCRPRRHWPTTSSD